MNWALLFAFLSPAIFGLMNVFDTFVIKRRVKHVLGFAIVSGIMNISLGVILALFLDWNKYSFYDLLFPILVGISLGVQLCFYYFVLSKHDVSHVIGLIFVYPLLVAILSYIFLEEVLSFTGYFAMVFVLIGLFTMNVGMKKLKITIALWSIVVVALTCALHEFFTKLSTFQMDAWHGTSVGSIVMGLVILPLLLNKNIRNGFRKEFKNIHLTFISEALTIFAVVTLYLAMAGMPATIVSIIGATQPLFVLLFEFIAFSFGVKIVKDEGWGNKLLGILLIVIGIAILYASEIA